MSPALRPLPLSYAHKLKDDYLEAYIQYMLTNKDKDMFIDKYHIEFFERFAQGNKAYYSAGLGLGKLLLAMLTQIRSIYFFVS